jgi:hypothetical protein
VSVATLLPRTGRPGQVLSGVSPGRPENTTLTDTADNQVTCTASVQPAGVVRSYDVAWRYAKSRHRLGGLKT